MSSLWGEEFEIKVEQKSTKSVLDKIKKSKDKVVSVEKQISSKKIPIEEKINLIKDKVYSILGKYVENTIVIKTRKELTDYIDKAIVNGEIAIDTETNNSLDPLTCKLMGGCIYTPGQKNAYIPINHIDINTKKRLDWQLTENDIKEEFSRLSDTNIIMHNGKFDYKVIKCTCGLPLKIYWDTLVGAKILDENERAGLKQQYIEKIDNEIEKYSIESLFENIEYAIIDPELFALYAATDPFMTYKLYKWQREQFKKPGSERLYKLFREIETPLTQIIAEMELTGVCIDLEYSKRLSDKFHKEYYELSKEIDDCLNQYKDKIAEWRKTPEANERKKDEKTKSEQLEFPINLSSPIQLAILLYDVLKIPPVDKKCPRGTGEDIIKQMGEPICDLILKQRGLLKLINTYVDKLPECISPRDGRLHAEFLQFGADTGRFSSKNPNLQNIPARGDDSVRLMFTASPGYTLIGSDYSQQEPRLLAHYSQDENMIKAYEEGKDLYAMIASKVYKNNYEDNKEFFPDGSMNPEGKKRRTSVKSLLLGIMYGMGDAMTAERIHCTIEEAKNIKRDFFNSFPKVEKWINETMSNAHKLGYVEDVWGRRRRLPDLMLPRYEYRYDKKYSLNPLLDIENIQIPVEQNKIDYYNKKISETKYKKEIDEIIKEALLKDNIIIKSNTGFIAQAERQCVNARIQGGGATMSKRAILNVYNNDRLRELGFRLLILVHDEIIGECPEENKEEVKKLLAQCMLNASKPDVITPMKCDADDFKSWYYDVYSADVYNTFNKLKEKMSEEEAFNKICNDKSECTPEQLREMIEKIKNQ